MSGETSVPVLVWSLAADEDEDGNPTDEPDVGEISTLPAWYLRAS